MKNFEMIILIALDEEFQIFKEVLSKSNYSNNIDEMALSGKRDFSFFFTDSKGQKCNVLVYCINEMNRVPAATTTQMLVKAHYPLLVLNIGIAGAMAKDIKLGDIIIPNIIDAYDEQTKIVDERKSFVFEWSGKSYPATHKLAEDIINFHYNNTAWREEWNSESENFLGKDNTLIGQLISDNKLNVHPKLTIGPDASGPFVIASQNIKELILDKNRKFLCTEMESAGVAEVCYKEYPPIDFICLRTISDFSDKRKSTFDDKSKGLIRRWSMANLSKLTIDVLSALLDRIKNSRPSPRAEIFYKDSTLKEYTSTDEIHEFVVRRHINKTFRDVDADSWDYLNKFGDYFSLFVLFDNKRITSSLIKECVDYILNSKTYLPFIVYGLKGKGKSSFLSILYYALRLSNRENGTSLPIYLNIDRSYKTLVRQTDQSPGTIDKHLVESVEQLEGVISLASNQQFVIILDGIDESFTKLRSNKNNYFRKILNIIASYPNHKLVVGSRDFHCYEEGFSKLGKTCANPEKEILLSSIQTKSKDFEPLIDRFCDVSLINDVQSDSRFIKDKILEFKLFEVDTFTISLIARNLPTKKFKNFKSFSDFLKDYCIHRLRDKLPPGTNAEESFLLAANYEFNILSKSYDKNGETERGILGENEFISDFLLASYLVYRIITFQEDDPKGLNCFRYVFRDKRNNFFKELINVDNETTTIVLENLIKIYNLLKKSQLTAKYVYRGRCHMCYLAGRIEDKGLRNNAIEFLRYARKDIISEKEANPDLSKNDDFGLLNRTVYISLAYSGHEESMNEYIERLFTDPYEDNLNRGFHLQYYGDQEFDPNFTMNYEDELGDCNKTFNHIAHKILNLNRRAESNLIEIEVHTLLSIIQHRHYAGKLNLPMSEVLITLNRLIEHDLIRNQHLKQYCHFMLTNLKLPVFPRIKPVFDLYRLKNLPRMGWEKLGIGKNYNKRIESVAEHTFGAYLLAYFFLNENGSEQGSKYCKDTVLKMLFIHDLAEAFTGDIISKNEEERRIEKRWFQYLSLVGTYDGIAGTTDIIKLWSQFENRSSIDGNIAKDFDLLESLFQLLIYKDYIDQKDFEDFWNNVSSRIETVTVIKIKDCLEKYLKNIKSDNNFLKWPKEIVSDDLTF